MYKRIKLNETDINKSVTQILKEHNIYEYSEVYANDYNIIVVIENTKH